MAVNWQIAVESTSAGISQKHWQEGADFMNRLAKQTVGVILVTAAIGAPPVDAASEVEAITAVLNTYVQALNGDGPTTAGWFWREKGDEEEI